MDKFYNYPLRQQGEMRLPFAKMYISFFAGHACVDKCIRK